MYLPVTHQVDGKRYTIGLSNKVAIVTGASREFGAAEAAALVKKNDFPPSSVAFDAAFQK